MKKTSAIPVVILMLVAACEYPTSTTSTTSVVDGIRASAAPSASARIPNEYIVVFKSSVGSPAAAAAQLANRHGGTVRHVYSSAIRGMALSLPDAAVTALANNPEVAYIEQDQVVSAISVPSSGVQSPVPSWGLDRIDQQALPGDDSYAYAADGSGVTAYIIDSGIRYTHAEFAGRVFFGMDAIDTRRGTGADCSGHGTSVAGIVGGSTYGVAKNVRLVSVRVLGCSGSGAISGVIAGIDWVTANRTLPAVANMSLGGGYSVAHNQAIENSIAAGVFYSVSAGNDSTNACVKSPASAPGAITTAASNRVDAMARFSNMGSCVDIVAPGSGAIVTASNSDDAGITTTFGGTSAAAPHVAGAAALHLSMFPGASVGQVRAALVNNATPAVFFRGDGAGGVGTEPTNTTPLLLYTGGLAGLPLTIAPPASSANITSSCSGLSCTFDGTGSVNAASYRWDAGSVNGTGATFTTTFPKNASRTVVLTVRDVYGNGAIASKTVSCGAKSCS